MCVISNIEWRQKKNTAVLIGRFQPFHRGHEKAVAYLLRRYPRVRLVIGSSQYRRTKENPFSAGEREKMIIRVIGSHAGWRGRVNVRTMPDCPGDDGRWTRALARRFDATQAVVASANALVRRLGKKAGFALDPSPLFGRMRWEGRTIRRLARAGKRWEDRVPAALKKWMRGKGARILCRMGAP